jgi:acetyltransferase-like isoleucine patch superfamily enzyme
LSAPSRFFWGPPAALVIGDRATIGAGVTLTVGETRSGFGRLVIGGDFFINRYSMIDCCIRITIGDDVRIGPHAYICDFDHDIRSGPSPKIGREHIGSPVLVENHVWIGANAVILKGVTVGEGAVVGAGAVVTRDVPRLAVVAGAPARVLRIRDMNNLPSRGDGPPQNSLRS